jgi:hypothetical protein
MQHQEAKMFVYTTEAKAQAACDRFNDHDFTKDWCGRPTEDNGKRAFPTKVPHGWGIKLMKPK